MIKYFVYSILYVGIFVSLPNTTYYVLHTTYPAYAAEATKSATPSSTLQDKLKVLKDEIASKAAQFRQDVDKRLQNKSYAGVVKEVTDQEIIIVTKNGDKKLVLDEYTIYQTSAKKPSFKDIVKDDYIVGLGDLDDKDNLVSKKVIEIKKPAEVKTVYFGQVLSVTSPSFLLKTRESEIKVNTTSKTTFIQGTSEAAFSNLVKNKFVAVSGTKNGDNFLASFVYLIQLGGFKKEQ